MNLLLLVPTFRNDGAVVTPPPVTPAPGVVSYGSGGGGGGSGVSREYRERFARLLDESLEAKPKKKKKKKATAQETPAQEVERLLASLQQVAAAMVPVQVAIAAPARVATVQCDHGGDALLVPPPISPARVGACRAEGIENPSDDELAHMALLAFELSQASHPSREP